MWIESCHKIPLVEKKTETTPIDPIPPPEETPTTPPEETPTTPPEETPTTPPEVIPTPVDCNLNFYVCEDELFAMNIFSDDCTIRYRSCMNPGIWVPMCPSP